MQIRVANRQDEKGIRQFVSEIMAQDKGEQDADDASADLVNVEANYFGKNGAFLVAEHEGKLVAIAGASQIDDNTLALRRICVAANWRGKGVGRKLLDAIVAIAKRLYFKTVLFSPFSKICIRLADETEAARFFHACGFTDCSPVDQANKANEQTLALEIEPI